MINNKIKFVDLIGRYAEEKEELLACIDTVLSKGHLVLTQEVNEFEEAAAQYIGIEHVIGLNSGTDALMMALWAYGIGKGDEVITTPISFIASTASIIHIGAKPVYVDVGSDQNIDPTKIEEAITPKTKAILPVHWGGRIANMKEINEIAKKHKLIVIEDAAQGMGSYLNGQHSGNFSHASAFSCHPLKNLNALGDAGFMGTNDDEIAKKIRLYRSHGLESRDNAVMYGVNSRLDVLNAEVLKFRLTKLKEVVNKRRLNVETYKKIINTDNVFIPKESENEYHSYVMFIIQAEHRDELKEYLESLGIETLIYYGKPLHLQSAAKFLNYKEGDFPIAESQCKKVLALPHHQYISNEEIEYVANHINLFYKTDRVKIK